MPSESTSNPSSDSFFKFYSIGIVAANKPLDTWDIEVTPMEVTSLLSGEVTDNSSDYQGKGVDAQGAAFSSSVKSTSSIQATWYPGDANNRITAPDVRRGEMVEIWRFADTDQYFWKSSKQSKRLRRLETVIFSYSNNSKEDIDNDADSQHYLAVSTHQQSLTLHTSKNDGEYCTYDIQINTKDGNIVIQDDREKYIFMDSKHKRIKMHNEDGSLLDLNQKDILMKAPDSITLETKVYKLNATTSNTINSPTNATHGQTQLIEATTTNQGTMTITRMTTMNGGFNARDLTGETGGGDVGAVIGRVRFRDDVIIEGNLHVEGTSDLDGKITSTVDADIPNID